MDADADVDVNVDVDVDVRRGDDVDNMTWIKTMYKYM